MTDNPRNVDVLDALYQGATTGKCISRVHSICDRRGLQTLGELADQSARELLLMKNVGRKTVRAIDALLAEHGLVLRP